MTISNGTRNTFDAPASQRQHLTTVTGWPGNWATFSGGETTADVSEVYDGGNPDPISMSSPAKTSNVVVGRPYRPAQHAQLVREWEKTVGRRRASVSRYDTDEDLNRIGRPSVYANALLVRVTRPDGDASSADAAMLELEFAVSRPAS